MQYKNDNNSNNHNKRAGIIALNLFVYGSALMLFFFFYFAVMEAVQGCSNNMEQERAKHCSHKWRAGVDPKLRDSSLWVREVYRCFTLKCYVVGRKSTDEGRLFKRQPVKGIKL